jgi:hypothetical protein
VTSQATIDSFLQSKEIAVIGVSRSGQKFGNTIFRELRDKGYVVYPVNPHADEIEGTRCYRSVRELPDTVEGIVVVVKPEQSEQVVREAAAAGIGKVWLQQGAESREALAACDELGTPVVSRNCILMFVEPVESIHKFHRFLRRIFGKMPA